MDIDSQIRIAADLAIHKLMEYVRGIKAVVISSEDGVEIASRVENTAQVSRLSAMASSLAALGALAGEESQLGHCDNILIGAEQGHLIMMQARHPQMLLIISIIAGKDAIIGQALYFARQASRMLENHMGQDEPDFDAPHRETATP